jgi:hypothetical protein
MDFFLPVCRAITHKGVKTERIAAMLFTRSGAPTRRLRLTNCLPNVLSSNYIDFGNFGHSVRALKSIRTNFDSQACQQNQVELI